MKINDPTSLEHLKAYNANTAKKVGSSAGADVNGTSLHGIHGAIRDRVDISDNVQLLVKIKDAVDKSPDIRMDKVRNIQEKLAKGEYKPDFNAIADKLLSPDISKRI